MSKSGTSQDIFLIPHFYDIRWARKTSQILSEYFNHLDIPLEFPTYLPGKTVLHEYIAKSLPYLRSKKITRVLFFNIMDDFSLDIIRCGFVKEVYGFVHGSRRQTFEGIKNDYIDYEKSIADISKKLFSGTEFIAKDYPYPTVPIGLPVDYKICEPKTSNKLLYNHRLNKYKGPLKMLELPEDLKKDLIVSTPKFATMYVTPIKEANIFMDINPPDDVYQKYLDECGFGLCFSDHDSLGHSVIETIFNGLLCLVPDNDNTPYKEFCIKEVLYKDIPDLVEKIRYYREHTKERYEAVKKSQELVKKYAEENWLKTLFKELNVEVEGKSSRGKLF